MLGNALKPFSETAYALLRVTAGLMFTFHGVQKIFGVLTEKQPETFSQIWIGGVIELVGGLLIAAGAYTTWAAFLCSSTMAVAYAQFHWKLQGGPQLLPAINKGELALLYSVVFLFLATRGSGSWSLDRWRARGAPER